MTERKTVERLTRDILDADTEFGACTNRSAKSIAARLVSMGWEPSIVHQCCEDAQKYRPRVVESVEELESLPRGSVIRCPDGEIGLVMVTRDKRHVVGYPGHLPTDELSDVDLPATVLHTPNEAP